MSKPDPMLLNVGFRMAYGIGGLLSPPTMARLQLAADTPERPAALAALAIDAADMVAAGVEAGKRGELGADLAGGLVFSAAGVATALAAFRLSG